MISYFSADIRALRRRYRKLSAALIGGQAPIRVLSCRKRLLEATPGYGLLHAVAGALQVGTAAARDEVLRAAGHGWFAECWDGRTRSLALDKLVAKLTGTVCDADDPVEPWDVLSLPVVELAALNGGAS